MTHVYTLCTGPIGGAVSIGKGRVLVSLQGDGVSCYDISTRKPVLSWALGTTDQEFSGATVYDYASNLCFAPVAPRSGGATRGSTLLAWSADDSSGTLVQLSKPIHLPQLHALFPLTNTPETEEEEAAAAAADERGEAEVDGSGAAQPGALAVLAGGGVALCGASDVVAEAEAGPGRQLVAASYRAGALVTLCTPQRGAATLHAAVLRVQGGGLVADEPAELLPPREGCRPLAAACTGKRTAVLWSDGTVAVYLLPGGEGPPFLDYECYAEQRQAAATRRLAAFDLPAAPGKQKGGGAKKRGAAAAASAAASGAVGMAAMGDKQVALAGWATDGEGATILRLVVLETGCAVVQLAHDVTAQDVGLPAFDPSKPVQLDSLGSGTNQLSISVGTAVLLATCSDLLPPTAFNLIGAMDLHRAMESVRLNSGGGGGGDVAPGLLPVPALGGAAAGGAVRRVLSDGPLLGCTAEVNPMAAAALRVLHPDEVAAATHPLGGRARPMTIDAELGKPTQPGQWLVRARTTWRCTQPEDDDALAAEEQRVWQEVAQPAAAPPRDDAALEAAVQPLLALRRRSGMALSPRLVHRLLMLAAEHGCWGTVAAVLKEQHPGLLSDVPGLAAAAAAAGQFGVVEQLLQPGPADEMGLPELLALLRVLLSPAGSPAAEQARRDRAAAAAAAAEAAEEAAERAAQGQEQQQQQQPQQQQQQQAPPLAKPGRRARRKAAAEVGGAAGAAAASTPGQGGAPAGQPGPANEAAPRVSADQLYPPGSRQRAVATCCRAAVEDLPPAAPLLHPLVSLRLRAEPLGAALRHLGADHSVALLAYLVPLLRNHLELVGGAAVGWQPPLALPAGVALPPAERVLCWLQALLETHLWRLTAEPQAVELLKALQQLVEARVPSDRPLLLLAGAVQLLLDEAADAAAGRSAALAADYSVQWLDLRVLPGGQRAGEEAAQEERGWD